MSLLIHCALHEATQISFLLLFILQLWKHTHGEKLSMRNYQSPYP